MVPMASVIIRLMSTVALDLDRQAGKPYDRLRRRLMLIDLALGAVYLLLWLFAGWSQALKSYLLTWTSNEWLLVAGFGLVFGVGYLLITLPLSYLRGSFYPSLRPLQPDLHQLG